MSARLTRRRAAALVATLACVLPFGSAQAASSGDNSATAIVEQDDGRAFDFAWDISRQRGDDPVLNQNSATATARCLRCRARAIAFQIVLVSGSPSTVVPVNTAEAKNIECTDCEAVAEARQFVRVFPRRVRFTGTGRAILSDVREDLEALEAQDPPIDQLHLAIEEQESRVRSVLNNELVLRSDPDREPNVLERQTLQDADLN